MKKVLNLEKLVYLCIFFLPVYLVRLHISFFRTNALEVFVSVAIFWWLVVFYKKEKIEKLYAKYARYIFCGVVMLAGLFWSALSHDQIWQSLNIIKSWFLLPLALMLVAADVVPQEKIKNIFRVYGASSFAVALISLGYWLSGELTYDGRLQAFFNSPNYLAMYLAPGLLIVFWETLFSGIKKNTAIFSAVLLTALFLTYSYAAWGALFIAMLIVLWLGKKKNFTRINFSKIAIAMLLIFGLMFFSQINKEKFQNLRDLNPRSSLASRAMIWQAAEKMVANNWVHGIGPANFQKTYLEYQKFFPPYLEWAVPHPQNLYLDFWLSGGILGLLGFLGLLFFFFRDIWQNKNQNTLNVLVLGVMLYILVHGIFDTTYFKNDLAVVFWLNFLALKKSLTSIKG